MITTNIKEAFAQAVVGPIGDSFGPIEKFMQNLSKWLPDEVDPSTLVLALDIALRDHVNTNGDYYLSAIIGEVFLFCIKYTPTEFFQEFRNIYLEKIMGLIPWEAEGKERYECIISLPGTVDITKKDPFAVFAALYNASIPFNLGLIEYDPSDITPEEAKEIFLQSAKKTENGYWIKYAKGRALSLYFSSDLRFVSFEKYNNLAGRGLAEIVIATVPDVRILGEENPIDKELALHMAQQRGVPFIQN